MPAIINSIEKDSIAEELELSAGDEIISVNGIKPRDLIDYNFLTASDDISLHVLRSSGEEEIFDIEKDFEEPLGINFESAVFDRVKPCNNKCVFCFVDQQPKGLRKTLYVKDDDYRLSYLQGTYVTLTNLNAEDKKRIEEFRPGPLYVSVHTTNPSLRALMLNNKKASAITDSLKWLNKLEIPVHTQIVLCPGFNDGDELNRTFEDLSSLSNIMSVAVVPVGITKYREGQELKKVDEFQAAGIIEQIEKFNNKTGKKLIFASDEIYFKAGYDLPDVKYYGNFGQLDDGVGSSTLLLNDFAKNRKLLPKSLKAPKKMAIVTGSLSYTPLKKIVDGLNKIQNLDIELIQIKSSFWGEDVTVSGLITGSDILENLLPYKSQINNLIIPSVMLRKLTDEFLDGYTVSDIQEKLNAKVFRINDYYSTSELIEIIKN